MSHLVREEVGTEHAGTTFPSIGSSASQLPQRPLQCSVYSKTPVWNSRFWVPASGMAPSEALSKTKVLFRYVYAKTNCIHMHQCIDPSSKCRLWHVIQCKSISLKKSYPQLQFVERLFHWLHWRRFRPLLHSRKRFWGRNYSLWKDPNWWTGEKCGLLQIGMTSDWIQFVWHSPSHSFESYLLKEKRYNLFFR